MNCTAVCIMPNCGRRAPVDHPLCGHHRNDKTPHVGAGAGWKLLPVKHVDADGVTRPGITNEMVDAFWSAWAEAQECGKGHYESAYAAWHALCEAAPTPPGSDEPLQGEPGTARGQESSAQPEAAEMVGREEMDAARDAVIEQACECAANFGSEEERLQLAVLAYYRACGDGEMADDLEAKLIHFKVLSPSHSKESERG
jgi:hypothetical protein